MKVCTVLVLLGSLTGCLGGDSPAPAAGTGAVAPPADPTTRGLEPTLEGVGPPILALGTTFTFRTDGIYDGEETVTVVVAEATEGGYLLAGATEADLPTEAAWDRFWMGPADRSLNPTEGDVRLLDFPLFDGKTWAWGDYMVTARSTPISTPEGGEDGFTMERQRERSVAIWTYSPRLGFFASFAWRDNEGNVYENAVLERVGTSTSWVWYEPADWIGVGDGPAAAQTFDLDDTVDGLVASVGGTEGARIAITSPATALAPPWTFEALDAEEWATVILDPVPGTWTVTAAQPGDGYAYAAIVPLRWLRSSSAQS